MAAVEESRHLGIHCGRVWTILLLILTGLHLLACIGVTLVLRIHFKGFYSAAHLAIVSAVVAIFVFYHHLGKLRKTLGISKKKYSVYQVILNTYFLLCCIATAVGYTVLHSTCTINVSYDYLGALWFGWMSTVLMIYLLGVVISSSCTHQSSSYIIQPDAKALQRIHFRQGSIDLVNESFSEHDINSMRRRSRTKYADDPGFNIDPEEQGYPRISGILDVTPQSNRTRCCIACCRVFFWILYIILQILLIVIFFMTAYHPFCVIADINSVRNDAELYTVDIEGYRDQALFLSCHGNGKDTIVFEGDIRSTAAMYADGLPKYLIDKYSFRVCVYDRRGKGWSEGLEQDYIDAQVDEPQWSKTNVQFLKELVKKAGITTPFYYAGIGYGAHHVTYMALLNSRLLKGLIYISPAVFGENSSQIDNTRYEDLKSDASKIEAIANLHATGFLKLGDQLGILDMQEDILEDYTDFTHMSESSKDWLFSSLRSGTYFSAQVRENEEYLCSNFATDGLNKDLQSKTIDTQLLVIEGDKNGVEPVLNWFPQEHFSNFSAGNILTIKGANQNALLMDPNYIKIAADFINKHINA